MKKHYKLLIKVISLTILSAIGWRIFILFIFNNVGTGEYKESPNKKFTAHIMSYTSESFFGSTTSWFQYTVTKNGSNEQIYFLKTDEIEGEYFGSRSSHNVIKWKEDSTEILFIFPNTEIKVKIKN